MIQTMNLASIVMMVAAARKLCDTAAGIAIQLGRNAVIDRRQK
jgi:hypothetical protein